MMFFIALVMFKLCSENFKNVIFWYNLSKTSEDHSLGLITLEARCPTGKTFLVWIYSLFM
jgi:hypothetical protein